MPRLPNSSPQTLLIFGSLIDDPEGWHYGYALSKQTGLKPGTLYPILARLVNGELLETRWEPSEQAGRPPRHLYRLTPEGIARARARLSVAADGDGAHPPDGRPRSHREESRRSASAGPACGMATSRPTGSTA